MSATAVLTLDEELEALGLPPASSDASEWGELPELGLGVPTGFHDSVRALADVHARAIIATRDHRARQSGSRQYPTTIKGFIREVLGMELTETQEAIVDAMETHQRIAIKSCHGSGKTRVLAAIVIAYLHINEFSKVITTGPGGVQLKEGLWQDIRYLASQARVPLLSEPLTTKWEIAPGWFALGYKPAERRASNLQGYHAPKMLLVVDEAAEVEQEIYGALASLITSDTCHLVMIGNPTKIGNPFHAAFTTNAHMWHNITITANDTPNVQAGHTVVEGLITTKWVQDAIDENGEDSDYVRSRVWAEFPKNSAETFIPLEWVEGFEKRYMDYVEDVDVWEAGLDVARFGADKSCLTIRCGPVAVYQESWQGLDTMATVGKSTEIFSRYPKMSVVRVDTIGLGAGVADRLNELGYPVEFITVSEKSQDPKQFASVRQELWWKFRELLRQEQICAGPAFNQILKTQLTSIRAKYDSSHTRPIVESKEQMKARKLPSPDEAESMMLAFVGPDKPVKKERPKSVAPVGVPQTSAWNR